MARPYQLAIRLSRAENAQVNRQAKAAKLAPSVWARSVLIGLASNGRAASGSAQTPLAGEKPARDKQDGEVCTPPSDPPDKEPSHD